ncbi:unannotated protein [freshwater metagenome]|uniref:Unannotated protein n=1 Tax=freshwater metagenome TaxID=449393 RepID=A0A6J6TQX4_9ZZZZ
MSIVNISLLATVALTTTGWAAAFTAPVDTTVFSTAASEINPSAAAVAVSKICVIGRDLAD